MPSRALAPLGEAHLRQRECYPHKKDRAKVSRPLLWHVPLGQLLDLHSAAVAQVAPLSFWAVHWLVLDGQ